MSYSVRAVLRTIHPDTNAHAVSEPCYFDSFVGFATWVSHRVDKAKVHAESQFVVTSIEFMGSHQGAIDIMPGEEQGKAEVREFIGLVV